MIWLFLLILGRVFVFTSFDNRLYTTVTHLWQLFQINCCTWCLRLWASTWQEKEHRYLQALSPGQCVYRWTESSTGRGPQDTAACSVPQSLLSSSTSWPAVTKVNDGFRRYQWMLRLLNTQSMLINLKVILVQVECSPWKYICIFTLHYSCLCNFTTA